MKNTLQRFSPENDNEINVKFGNKKVYMNKLLKVKRKTSKSNKRLKMAKRLS